MMELCTNIKKVTPTDTIIHLVVIPILLCLVFNSNGVQSQNATCQEGWTEHGDHCYWSPPGLLISWEAAQNYCQSHDSNLVKVETSEENSWLKTFATLSDYPWIGANDRDKEGEWRWISDNSEVTYTDWVAGEPNNAGNEHCVLYNRDKQWNDRVCTNQFGFICEESGISICGTSRCLDLPAQDLQPATSHFETIPYGPFLFQKRNHTQSSGLEKQGCILYIGI